LYAANDLKAKGHGLGHYIINVETILSTPENSKTLLVVFYHLKYSVQGWYWLELIDCNLLPISTPPERFKCLHEGLSIKESQSQSKIHFMMRRSSTVNIFALSVTHGNDSHRA
jgi:hypothetical protein